MMKNFLLISIACSLALLYSHAVASDKLMRWGYIAHYSRLDSKYINTSVAKYDAVCVTGWHLDAAGIRRHRSSDNYIDILKKARIEIYPLVSFRNVNSGIKILSDSKLIDRSAALIASEARAMSLRGVHLDFEYIPNEYLSGLAQLINSIKERNITLKISMAMFPQIDFPREWSAFHDPEILKDHVDEVVLMCYDYHRSGTAPGPVTDMDWADKNIAHLLKFFKPEQVWLGVPAYGYVWSSGTKAEAVSAKHGALLKKKYGFTRDKSGCARIELLDKGRKKTAYISDRETIAGLENIAKKYRIKGTALWRLGFEE